MLPLSVSLFLGLTTEGAEKYSRISGKNRNRLKKLLLSKPHRDMEISIGRQSDSGSKIVL